MTIQATCICGWTEREYDVEPCKRVMVQKIVEWAAHMHELNQRRAYQHDTTVRVLAA